MDVQERIGDPLKWVPMALAGRLSRLWTALPGIIQSFDPDAMAVTVQPAVRSLVRDEQGAQVEADLPLLVDCPVQFPSGGGCTLTFPVTQGDECLVVFASRCIDAWWQSGGIQNQAELRMHDLSDGFALLGFRSQPRVIPAISTTAAQLRSDDGQAFVEIDPGSHAITAKTPGPLILTAPLVTIEGDVKVRGRIDADGDVKAGSISQQHHTHPGDSGGTTGEPNA